MLFTEFFARSPYGQKTVVYTQFGCNRRDRERMENISAVSNKWYEPYRTGIKSGYKHIGNTKQLK